MKILLINSVCGYGSTGHIVADLWNTLKRCGNIVKVAYGFGKAIAVDQNDRIKISSKFGYYFDNFFSKLTDRTGLFSHFQTKRLISKINEFNPDIIHLHNIHGYYLNYDLLFKYLAENNIKVVWTLHDCWAVTGHCVHFSYINCNKWKSECNKCPQKNKYPKSWFFDSSKSNYQLKKLRFTSVKDMNIVTPSEWLANIVQMSFLRKYTITSIPNGIDINKFKYTNSDFRTTIRAKNKIILLSVAAIWYESKGLYDVFNLAKKLNNKYTYVVVGLNEKQKDIAPSNIIAIDKTNSINKLIEIYSSADVFINTSYEETMGMVTIEAIACGTPAIVYNSTAVPEIIDNTCGKIVPAGDIDAIVKNIDIVAQLDRIEVARKAQAYSKSQQYEKYIKLYESIVSRK